MWRIGARNRDCHFRLDAPVRPQNHVADIANPEPTDYDNAWLTSAHISPVSLLMRPVVRSRALTERVGTIAMGYRSPVSSSALTERLPWSWHQLSEEAPTPRPSCSVASCSTSSSEKTQLMTLRRVISPQNQWQRAVDEETVTLHGEAPPTQWLAKDGCVHLMRYDSATIGSEVPCRPSACIR
jgi:hypothetical protein